MKRIQRRPRPRRPAPQETKLHLEKGGTPDLSGVEDFLDRAAGVLREADSGS